MKIEQSSSCDSWSEPETPLATTAPQIATTSESKKWAAREEDGVNGGHVTLPLLIQTACWARSFPCNQTSYDQSCLRRVVFPTSSVYRCSRSLGFMKVFEILVFTQSCAMNDILQTHYGRPIMKTFWTDPFKWMWYRGWKYLLITQH